MTPDAMSVATRYFAAGDLHAAQQQCLAILEVDPRCADALHFLGVIAYRNGQFDSAADLVEKAITLQPDSAEFHGHLGLVYQALNRFDEAIASQQRALQLNPRWAEGHNNLGTALAASGRLPQAADSYREALRLKPEFGHALYNLGNCLSAQGQFAEAARCFRAAAPLLPTSAEVRNNLGNVLNQLGRFAEAEACLREAVELAPDWAPAHHNLGKLLMTQNRGDEAAGCFRRAVALTPASAEYHNSLALALYRCSEQVIDCGHRAIALDPNNAEYHNNLGAAYAAVGRLNEAASCYHEALRLRPNYAEAHYNLGNAKLAQDEFDEAVASYHRALKLFPESPEIWVNLGNALRHQLKLAEAIEAYDRALRLRPDFADAGWNRAQVLLLMGEYERGWPEFEWRWRHRDFIPPSFAQPKWDGSPLAGRTILLSAEQGLGDTIQFVRFVPKVKELGGRVLLTCQKPLAALLERFPGTDLLVPVGSTAPAFDVYAPLMSLPGILKVGPAISMSSPYLSANPNDVERWRNSLQPLDGFRIGIAWQGNPLHRRDRYRSIPLAQFERLTQVPGIRVISLQTGPAAQQLRQRPEGRSIYDLSGELTSFPETAAVMKNLDLVITTDTAVAHLAGALGVPVWVGLGHSPDWRWLLDSEDTPWYPTMRLFRQISPGDWGGIFDRIIEQLRRQVAS
jgi:tetratricopeptide (TPR) repeat protein